MLVKELMTDGAEWIGPDTCLKDSAAKMRQMNVGSLPVTERDRLIGMITDRDITCRGVAEGCDPSTTKVRDVMTKDVTYCFDDQDVADAVHLMEEKMIRRLPVLDHDQKMVGMLTVSDLSHGASQQLTSEVMKAVSKRH